MNITRFVDQEEISLEVEFLTPAFLGGADQNAELRSAPFKASLRYWWRILYGGGYKTKEELKAAEDALFGSTETGSRIRVSTCGEVASSKESYSRGKKIQVTSRGITFSINILDYLAYGKYKYQQGQGNIYVNSYIMPKQKFELSIVIPSGTSPDQVKGAVKSMIKYGGVGSRSRNGFGSLFSNDLEKIKWHKESNCVEKSKEFPVFHSQTRLYRTKDGYNSWEEALSEIGDIYRSARSSLENKHTFDRRGLISRPIEVRGETIPSNIRKGRHPKPFHLGVTRIHDKYYGQILSIPIVFYEDEKIDDYNAVISSMHEIFDKRFNNMSNVLFAELEAK